MRGLIETVFFLQLEQMVDSELSTTREFWRRKYFNASDAEAMDPRPFCEVLATRQERSDE